MRQGDGTDLLGPSDPRKASIGVIYVAPQDDRQSVLAAILTQDKLGRKQVAVVLPEQNKAFQRPVDFDGLKNMRRGLKTQIVFVTPSGPGPAEYARQRRFTVFSSLESFAQSLQADGHANGATRRGLFGHKQKHPNANGMTSSSSKHIEQAPTSPFPDNAPVATHEQASAYLAADKDGEETQRDAGALGVAGVAAGLGVISHDLNAISTHKNGEDNRPVPSSPAAEAQIGEELPSISMPAQTDENQTLAAANGTGSNAGPGIIVFPTSTSRPRTTAKLPVLPIDSVPSAQSNVSTVSPSSRRGSSGKMTAVAAGAAGAGAAMSGRAASAGGSPPPPRGNAGGPGSGGSPRRTRQLLAVLLVALTLLLIAGIAFAAPGGLGSLARILPGAVTTATVTITPVNKDLADTFLIQAVTGIPNPAERQVGARILTSTSATQSITAQASGSIPGLRAQGQLLFLNLSTSSIRIPGGILTSGRGVQVAYAGPIVVPPSTISVTGTAVGVGAGGNIGALDINGFCCGSNKIFVKNPSGFSGGQDPQAHAIVEQGDIDGAAKTLVASLTPGTQAALQKQMKPNEQLVANSLQCNKSTFTANHKAGDRASSVSVTVAITCKEEVYDEQAALAMSGDLLKAEANRNFGPNYALTGNIVSGVAHANVIDSKGTVSLSVNAEGMWVYRFSDSVQQTFKNHIANLSKQEALNYLTQQPGISSVQIDISSGSSMPDAGNISIIIKAIPGATGTPTTVPGSPTVAPLTPTAAPPVTPTQGLGG
jgi:hypothetical protein